MDKIISKFRKFGHLISKSNPIYNDINNKLFYNISDESIIVNYLKNKKNIKEILRNIYCGNIGYEYMHIYDNNRINWIESKILFPYKISSKIRLNILKFLCYIKNFEKYVSIKFIGQKRFSIKGGDSLLPAIYELIYYSINKYEIYDIIFGMSHRGRLNFINTVLNRPYYQTFCEFMNKDYVGYNKYSYDVKYHLGYYTKFYNYKKKITNVNLIFNPSHLETTNSVVHGISRSKIDNVYNGNNNNVLSICIHGDASISGQGIVYEIAQMSNLDSFNIGGTIHIVINNQIGYTTNPKDGRSSIYPTDIAKLINAPIIHVNCHDVIGIVKSLYLAIDYKIKFSSDIYINFICYRKFGHNEGDEPRFTQFELYKIIDSIEDIFNIYMNECIKDKLISANEIKLIEDDFNNKLEKDYEFSNSVCNINFPVINIINYKNNCINYKNINYKDLKKIGYKLLDYKNNILFNKTLRFINIHKKMLENDIVDWSLAELLSYAVILINKYNIRISGQDVERGTFSHRHAVLHTLDNNKYIPLNNLCSNQGKLYIYNSLLSEYAVLGYEFGYSIASVNDTLNIWEAQFGDFSNGAQVIIDQYISSCEDKWKINSGLVLFLPHGYEGQGAEHSSARIERFLQMCAKYNMYVVNCTTPSNLFHILLKQICSNKKKPLIIFTPKSLLRNKLSFSKINDITDNKFKDIIVENNKNINKINKIVLCSGKIYYDIISMKDKFNFEKILIIRLELLYPINICKLKNIFNKYKNVKKIIWAQEEPENMGAKSYILNIFNNLSIKCNYICQDENASTVTSSLAFLKKNIYNIIYKIFNI